MASCSRPTAQPERDSAVAVRASKEHFHAPAPEEAMGCLRRTALAVSRLRPGTRSAGRQQAKGRAGAALFRWTIRRRFLSATRREAWQARRGGQRPASVHKAPQGKSHSSSTASAGRADVSEAVRRGAHVYVCGDGSGGAAVRETFSASTRKRSAHRRGREAWVAPRRRESRPIRLRRLA